MKVPPSLTSDILGLCLIARWLTGVPSTPASYGRSLAQAVSLEATAQLHRAARRTSDAAATIGADGPLFAGTADVVNVDVSSRTTWSPHFPTRPKPANQTPRKARGKMESLLLVVRMRGIRTALSDCGNGGCWTR